MTYILVNKNKKDRATSLRQTLNKVFNKDFSEAEILNCPDIHILSIEDKNSIGIEDIKDFQTTMRYRPFQEGIQAGIIIDAQKLTPQAQNALLKTLEETSKYSVYILPVDNEKNLLATIRSRGRIIYSKSNNEEPEEKLETKNILESDLYNKFLVAEKYSADKDSSLELITNLEEYYRKKLELDIKNGNIGSSKIFAGILSMLQKSREKIVANCNRRLVLESVLLQLNA